MHLCARPGIRISDDLGVGHRLASSDYVEPGTDAVFSVDLPLARYDFFCSVGGHAQAGMKGTIVRNVPIPNDRNVPFPPLASGIIRW